MRHQMETFEFQAFWASVPRRAQQPFLGGGPTGVDDREGSRFLPTPRKPHVRLDSMPVTDAGIHEANAMGDCVSDVVVVVVVSDVLVVGL